jgi:glutathione synthase
MNAYRLLVLTDHRSHSPENSLYALLQAIRKHPKCAYLAVASRGTQGNQAFFTGQVDKARLYATTVDEHFDYSDKGAAYQGNLQRVRLSNFDAILLRLPPPYDPVFAKFLVNTFPEHRIINRPSGIARTASKAFLLDVADLCPPIQLVESVGDLLQWKDQFPFVLKPLNNYGGKGIVKVDGDRVWSGDHSESFLDFLQAFAKKPEPLLAMQYLDRVHEGDKRVVVCNGTIMGASLRLPAQGSWLCNAAQGGMSVSSGVTPEEERIANELAPRLKAEGVILFGFDTLVDNQGKRVLSEINTMSIGGLKQMEIQMGRPMLQEMADLIIQYITDEVYGPCVTNV